MLSLSPFSMIIPWGYMKRYSLHCQSNITAFLTKLCCYKIIANKVAFPSHVDPYAKDLIRRLLTADRSKRLGNLRGGAKDVMAHRWFTGVDWNILESKKIGAPIIPHVANRGSFGSTATDVLDG
jgi:hypothetical protein